MKIEPKVEFSLTLNLKITETEAKALDAIAGYDIEEYLKVFYEKMGSSYLKPHEAGLRSLFKTVRAELPFQLGAVEKVRKAIAEINNVTIPTPPNNQHQP